MTELVPKTISPNAVEQIRTLIERGVEAWKEAGRIVAELIDRHGQGARDELECAGLSTSVIHAFEMIGRGGLYAPILLDSRVSRVLSSAPYPEQYDAWENGVEVLEEAGEHFDVRRIPARELTPAQWRLVMGTGGIRTPTQQRSYLADQRDRKLRREALPAMKEEAGPAFRIIRGQLVIDRPCAFTAQQITQILGKLVR